MTLIRWRSLQVLVLGDLIGNSALVIPLGDIDGTAQRVNARCHGVAVSGGQMMAHLDHGLRWISKSRCNPLTMVWRVGAD